VNIEFSLTAVEVNGGGVKRRLFGKGRGQGLAQATKRHQEKPHFKILYYSALLCKILQNLT
jgi:hypothetical protein